jgi:hypothetical protein
MLLDALLNAVGIEALIMLTISWVLACCRMLGLLGMDMPTAVPLLLLLPPPRTPPALPRPASHATGELLLRARGLQLAAARATSALAAAAAVRRPLGLQVGEAGSACCGVGGSIPAFTCSMILSQEAGADTDVGVTCTAAPLQHLCLTLFFDYRQVPDRYVLPCSTSSAWSCQASWQALHCLHVVPAYLFCS